MLDLTLTGQYIHSLPLSLRRTKEAIVRMLHCSWMVRDGKSTQCDAPVMFNARLREFGGVRSVF